ncbi:MAG: B12-binding domain-containing radical SAM protein, partial [Candidatus Electryoneaceae bacterium]|nr:B12-binding domain-containing radical SAM protein [Candidatus Electryoneaceae bacterium]
IKKILSNKPDIIGFSIYMWNRAVLLEIIKEIKHISPSILIIVGGPEVTADFQTLKNNKDIDLTIPGEGEKIINKIIEQINKGVQAEEIQKNISFEIIEELDSLPSPIIDGTLDFKKGLLWELSRGCPFNCSFCYESKGSNKVRRFSIERTNRELDIIAESNIEQVFVLDPTFNYNKEAAKQILELIQIKAPHITFYFEVRSEFLDEEMAFLFSQITCIIQIGVQSINSKVLETINRNIDIHGFEKQVYLLHEASVPYGFDLIYGLPKDSLKSFCKSLDFVIGLAPNHIDIFPLSVLPGTELADNADRLQLNYLKDNPYTVTSTTSFQEKEMRRAEKIANACTLFYNEGKAVPWFGIVTRALKIRPSKFLLQFANWEKIDNDTDILTKQIKFVEQLFFEQEKTNFAMIASD